MHNSESVEMCGQGEVFLANNDITKINKLFTDSGSSPVSSNLMRLHKKPLYLEKSSPHERTNE